MNAIKKSSPKERYRSRVRPFSWSLGPMDPEDQSPDSRQGNPQDEDPVRPWEER